MDQRREEQYKTTWRTCRHRRRSYPQWLTRVTLARWASDVKNSLKRCPAVPSSRSSRRNHREALVPLSIEELEALTAFFATQASSLQAALLKWGAGMAWAGR